jgi:DNA-binding XRE family transcriptional regulator
MHFQYNIKSTIRSFLRQLIKNFRKTLQMTQEQFAERVSISLRYVAKIENEGKL